MTEEQTEEQRSPYLGLAIALAPDVDEITVKAIFNLGQMGMQERFRAALKAHTGEQEVNLGE